MPKVETLSILEVNGGKPIVISKTEFPNLQKLKITDMVAGAKDADGPAGASPLDFVSRDAEEIHIATVNISGSTEHQGRLRIEDLPTLSIKYLSLPGISVEEKLRHRSLVVRNIAHVKIGNLSAPRAANTARVDIKGKQVDIKNFVA